MVTIKVECPANVNTDRQREFADTVIGAAVDMLGVERTGVRLDLTDEDEKRARREAAFWAAAWSGC
ncbi:hypothetical protein [Nonomuraea cavernae]|uniref:Tautomerase n=1 Tax=Nonomuraea cavernae TaxID=2045107 RepID=A0A917ZC49_9ACTN|nr:hypothetical protein [Nonomuraea cavernae]MCA2187588.1 hypothetical protein [Nonomuraea cavernae]GGO80331.1 hypothetical protein GCM10012289_66750 [Nonomuraea cavernae]